MSGLSIDLYSSSQALVPQPYVQKEGTQEEMKDGGVEGPCRVWSQGLNEEGVDEFLGILKVQ